MNPPQDNHIKEKPSVRGSENRSILVWLVVVFGLIGLFLRLYNLDNESLWLDEGWSIRVAHMNLVQIYQETSAYDVNPPLYFFILHFWINLIGDNEFSVRFLSVIFGFLSILMIYILGSLIFDKKIGFISSILLALSPFHVYYSQEARYYSLMMLLALLSIFFFIKLLNRMSFSLLIGYILFNTLLMYTHTYSLFIIIFENIYILSIFFLKKINDFELKRWISLQVVLFILYLPWIFSLLGAIFRVQSGYWLHEPSMRNLLSPFKAYSGGDLLLLSLFLMLLTFSLINIEKVKAQSKINKIYLLSGLMLTPIILPFIISKISTPIYLSRYTITASIPFYILAARGINNINYKYIKIFIIIFIIVLSLNSIGEQYTNVDKSQWREAANYIDLNAHPGDLLLFHQGYNQEDVFDYYSKRNDLEKKQFTNDRDKIDDENIKDLVFTLQSHNRIWVILSHDKDKGLIKKTLNGSYNLSYHKEFYEIDLSLWEKRPKRN